MQKRRRQREEVQQNCITLPEHRVYRFPLSLFFLARSALSLFLDVLERENLRRGKFNIRNAYSDCVSVGIEEKMPRPVQYAHVGVSETENGFSFFGKTAAEEGEREFSTLTERERASEGMNVCAANIHKMCMKLFFIAIAPFAFTQKLYIRFNTHIRGFYENYSSGFSSC